MTNLLSPPLQVDHVDSLKPATPADTALVETPVQPKDRDEANTEKPASSPYRASSSTGSSAPEDIQTKPDVMTYEASKFSPINGEQTTTSASARVNEPVDEIVVGTRAKKASLGLQASKSVEEQSNVDINEIKDEEQTALRVSKRKRLSRPVASYYEGTEEDEYQGEDPPAEKPVTRRSSLADVSQSAQVASGAMVPLDAPIHPVLRQPRTKKARHISPSNSPIDISGSELSDPPITNHTPTAAAPPMAAPPQPEAEGQPAGEKHRVLLGYWKHSSEKNPDDKHAVMGVLGNNNQLRPRLVKATRDGRHLIGNHPPGAGGVWRNWDEIEFEPHIRHLTRLQLKEYVRIRQRQIDAGETPEQVSANEAAAAGRAETAVEAGDQPSVADFVEPAPVAATQETPGTGPKRGRGRLPSVLLRDANRPKRTPPTVEQLNTRAQQQVAKAEAIQRRNSQRVSSVAASAAPASPPRSFGVLPPTPAPPSPDNPNVNRRVFDQVVGGMQRNWAAQAEAAARDGLDDAKVYLGTRYEYKRSGDFQGMYAAPGTIISIGDEDYVENRVLRRVGRRYSN